MSVVEALRGAAVEVRDTPGGLAPRAAAAARLAATVARELGAGLALYPWGVRAAVSRARTPAPSPTGAPSSVALARGVRYGPGPRQVADVWVAAAPGGGAAAAPPAHARPVALLIHGGVWSSGDKWTLGPAAAALAAASGAAVAVPNYALWRAGGDDGRGGGGIEGGLADVRAAAAWAARGGVAAALGGGAEGGRVTPTPPPPPPSPPPRLTLVGHSAGAHLAALAALADAGTPSAPAAVVGLAGAYDLTAHYEFERGRGVHYLSTMARAAAGAVEWEAGGAGGGAAPPVAPTPREAAGLEAASPTAILTDRVPPTWRALARPGLGRALAAAKSGKAASTQTAWLVLAGGADGTVPPSQTTAFAAALRAAGAPHVECDVLEGVSHVDFVTGWGWGGDGSDVPAWAQRVADVVAGR